MVSPARRFLTENFALYYPFGNTRSRNILADYSNRLDNKDNDVVTTKVYIWKIKNFLYVDVYCVAVRMETLDSLPGIRRLEKRLSSDNK